MLRLCAAALIACLCACAAQLVTQPAEFTSFEIGSRPAEVRIAQSTVVASSAGRRRELDAGSRWQAVGRIAQGVVYQRVGSVFAVQARDVHEAYLVVSEGRLQGFYLPAERAFSPANPPIPLNLGRTP